MSDILYKSKNAIVIYKPAGLPTQADKSGDADAMTLLSNALISSGERGELYLVHRLDRVVGGLLVFARNRASAAILSEQVSGAGLTKEYLAVIEGAPSGGELRDYLRKDGILGKATVVRENTSGAKEAVLNYYSIQSVSADGCEYSLVKIKLVTGRFHQIRAQFSSRGMPLVGDGKYGSKNRKSRMPALFACKIETELDGEVIRAVKMPDVNSYPWNMFSEDCYSNA